MSIKYETYEEASKATISLGITGKDDYRGNYKKDPRLPSNPFEKYNKFAEMGGFPAFCGKEVVKKYETYEEASKAAIALGIVGTANYYANYQKDPRLPRNPDVKYAKFTDKGGFPAFFGKKVVEKYETYEEASKAAIALGFTGIADYNKNYYKKDPKLPHHPDIIFIEFEDKGGFSSYLNTKVNRMVKKYETYEEASKAAIALEINDQRDYAKKYKKDPKLVARPDTKYPEFKEKGGLYAFLGKDFYDTYEEASQAAIALGCTDLKDYCKKCKIDPKLPSRPEVVYSEFDEKGGLWPYLGKAFYKTYTAASKAAIALGFISKDDYHANYKKDPKLPSNPLREYGAEFKNKGGWTSFLDSKRVAAYETYEEASKAAIALSITSKDDYEKKYKLDPKLRACPHQLYREFYDNGGFPGFLGQEIIDKYRTWKEASTATVKLGINSSPQYSVEYKKDPKLPSDPTRYFSNDWIRNGGYAGFFDKELGSIDTAKALRALRITDMHAYAQIDHLKLPENPLEAYDLESFNELLTLEVFDLAQVKAYCLRKEFNDVISYSKAASEQQHLPSPNAKTIKGYTSSESIITKLSLFELAKNAHPAYSQWFESALDFAKSGKNITRKKELTRVFIMEYVIGLEQPTEPGAFFFEKHKPPSLKEFMEKQPERSKDIISINILHDFINETFAKYCQDEEDGINVTLHGFHNKWPAIASTVEAVKHDQPDKSNKYPLAMNYIDQAAQFLIPETAETFQDITHIEADWYEVAEFTIDKTDPNCVWRTKDLIKGKKKDGTKTFRTQYQMWSPVRTCAMFTLFSMPLRGQQICWLDSGEADPEIPIINTKGEVEWVKNESHLINDVNKRAIRQGFIRRFEKAKKIEFTNNEGVRESKFEDIIGSYITTNKTSYSGGGYEVAYMPPHLIKWMIRLREWQSKYNPIKQLTPWENVSAGQNERNEKISKAMKSQAFLFRDPSALQSHKRCLPMNRQACIAGSFAWVLYQIQDKDNPLAFVKEGESPTAMASYESVFSPHCMRISFISAYVIDAKLPISVVAALVGHASLVMTIYYAVTTNQDYYDILSAGHQAAIAAAPARVAAMLKNKELKLSSSDFFDSNGKPVSEQYSNIPYAALAFKDFGICPFAASRCHEGGEQLAPKRFAPVRPGYLGPSNCFVCRFFITGPGFIGGLKTLCSEVNYEAKESGKRMEKYRLEKEKLELLQHFARKDDLPFEYEAKLNNIQNLYLQETVKFDALSQDAVLIALMGCRCDTLLKGESEHSDKKGHQLIAIEGNPILGIRLDDVSEFAQMTEICQNAELYSCSNPSRVLPKRTQMLDIFALKNGLSPALFQLSDEDQLKVGNQITSIMLNRLKGSWSEIDRLMDGSVSLKDLGLSATEIMKPVTLVRNHWASETENRIEVVNV